MYNWEDFDIQISLDNEEEKHTSNFICPKCNSIKKNKETNTLNIDFNNLSFFCEHCGFAGNLMQGVLQTSFKKNNQKFELNPYLKNSNFSYIKPAETFIQSFKNKKISIDTLNYFEIFAIQKYFPQFESIIPCIIYPYKKNNEIVNLIYANGKNRHSEIGGYPICFNYDNIDTNHTYLVYDELEVFSFFECNFKNTISLFNAFNDIETFSEKDLNQRLDFLTQIEETLKNVKKITIALPNSEKFFTLKDELLRRLGNERCWIVHPPEEGYTWNRVLIEYGIDKFQFLLNTAKPIPVKGIFDIDDVEDAFDNLYYKGFKRGAKTGWKDLDELYTVVPGQWTIVTGIPGHGKSNFLDSLLVNLAKHSDWNFAIFSPENQPIARHYANILEKYHGKSFDLGRPNRITESELEEGKEWLKEHFSVILPDEDASWSIDGVLELAKVLVYRKGIKGIVIDPWNELDHSRPGNQTETEYVSCVLTKIRQFARNYGVHVWLVAHPAKLYKDKDGKYPVPTPYDISGSAHYRNKADNAITVWRNVGHIDQDVSDIHVQKIRFKEVGRVGLASLRYEAISGIFHNDINQAKRQSALGSGTIVPTKELIVKHFEDDSNEPPF